MKKSQLIVLHSLWLNIYFQISLLFKPYLMNKIIWVAWGMDLYQWKIEEKRFIKFKIYNLISYYFRRKIKYFVGIFPPDIDFFKKEFKSEAITFYSPYIDLYNPIYNNKLVCKNLSEKIKDNECINIQIGHSATPILNHIEVLNNLKKYKNENIKINLPLNYGDTDYGDKVEKVAKSLFGDNVICIRELIGKKEYMDFLSKIDIAIFNTPRQIGLGNINPLLYMEKKIYMTPGSVMYTYFRSIGIEICDYDQIKEIDFDDFSKQVDMKKAKQYIKSNIMRIDNMIEMWTNVFNAIKK